MSRKDPLRSNMADQTPPQYGFTNNYQVSDAQRFFGQVLDALQDPRLGMAFPGVGMAGSMRSGMGRFFGPLSPSQMMDARMAKQAGNDSHFFNGPMAKYLDAGGSKPDKAPLHYNMAPTDNTQIHWSGSASNDPHSWANLLDRRHDRYQSMIQDGIAEGMSPSQAEAAIKKLNLAPPGLEQTENLRFFRRSPANDN